MMHSETVQVQLFYYHISTPQNNIKIIVNHDISNNDLTSRLTYDK